MIDAVAPFSGEWRAARKYDYGPAKGLPIVKLGAFTQALCDQKQEDGRSVVSMKDDWKTVFPF